MGLTLNLGQTDSDTASYRPNCMVNVARPWVLDRKSVAYPNMVARARPR